MLRQENLEQFCSLCISTLYWIAVRILRIFEWSWRQDVRLCCKTTEIPRANKETRSYYANEKWVTILRTVAANWLCYYYLLGKKDQIVRDCENGMIFFIMTVMMMLKMTKIMMTWSWQTMTVMIGLLERQPDFPVAKQSRKSNTIIDLLWASHKCSLINALLINPRYHTPLISNLRFIEFLKKN